MALFQKTGNTFTHCPTCSNYILIMGCVFYQVLEKSDAEEVQKEVDLYSILFVVIGVVTGLCMFLQVRYFHVERKRT